MAPVKEDLAKLKLSELAEELSLRGLDTSGKKAELVDRLWVAMSSAHSVGASEQGKGLKCDVKEQVSMEAGNSKSTVGDHNLPVPGSETSQSLLAKLRALKEMEQLEEQELRIKMRKQQLDIELKLAQVAGESVSEEVVEPLRIITDSKVRTSELDESSMLKSQMQRMLLPPTEIEKFDGNIMKYKLFIRSFEARIVSRTSDRDELLHYLEQLTVGKPKQIVRSCMYLGDKGYDEARRLLDQRYGSSHKVVDAYIHKLNNWGKILPGDVEELDRLTLYLVEIKHAMTDLDIAGELEHPRTLREVVEKLPGYLRDRWLRISDEIMEEEGRMVRFKDLVDFLAKEVRVKKNPIFGRSADSRQGIQRSKQHSLSHMQAQCSATAVKPGGEDVCLFCKGNHFLDDCQELKWRPMEERKRFIQSQRLCFGCLRGGHVAKFCKRRRKCSICGNQHATLLHRQSDGTQLDQTKPSPVNSNSVQVSSGGVTTDGGRGSHTLIPVIAVKVRSPSGNLVQTLAFCDSGSSGTFMSKGLAEQLGGPCKSATISLDTVCGPGTELSTSVMENIKVGPLDGECSFSLPPVFMIGHIPVSRGDMCDSSELRNWPHLRGVTLSQINAENEQSDVGLLIGANCPQLLMPEEVRRPEGNGPCAVRTCLGWYVMGPSHRPYRGSSGQHSVNRIRVSQSGCSGKIPELELFCQLYDQDFKDVSDEGEGLSVEDKEWLTRVKSSMRKDDAGHYEIGLPLRDFGALPDSYFTAKKRLEALRRRLSNDPNLCDEYVTVVQRLFDEGYAEKVPDSEIETEDRTWYIPHHSVRHPEKGKLRVVFDCSAKTENICLNDLLVKGPNLTNSLLGVLLRFRENPVAFTCDVDSMFHRVRLPVEDANMLRFLWFRDSDVASEVVVCRMRSHIFGAVSSPSVASFALRQCAEEGRERYPEAARIVDENVYVDDALVSASSVDEAIHLASDLKQLCQTGAFNMSKFASNRAEFLQSIPRDDRGKNVKDLDLEADSLRPERALGMLWSVTDDTFRFRFVDRQRPVTRRGILSTVSALFDPLGIASPVTLQGKALVQKLCSLSCGWDDPIPPSLEREWSAWLKRADRLDLLALSRCIGTADGEVVSRQLHVFSDASETGHSAVAFLRTETRTDEGTVSDVRFLMGKSLVNPVRFVTVPRLELGAAVVAVKLKVQIEKESGLKFDRTFLWTDSIVVLQYIRNRTSRYKTYVANRVGFIHDRSLVRDWRYVPSAVNPADVGSRGSGPEGLGMWLNGPGFLSDSEESWPCEPAGAAEDPADPEVKRSQSAVVSGAVAEVSAGRSAAVSDAVWEPSATERLVSYFSSWYKLRKAVAWYRRYFEVLKLKLLSRARVHRDKGLRSRDTGVETSLSTGDLRAAEGSILRYVQRVSFSGLSHDSEGNVRVTKASPLKGLNLAREDELLVVGGRLRRCPLEHNRRHPVVLPRDHHVTRLLVRDAHEKVGHQGREHTLAKVQEKFWIVGARSLIKSLVRLCVTCRRTSAVPQKQMMSDLPEDRVTPETPAFAFIGLDVFGPVFVKRGRSECKRYGLMCTCLVTRAVHVEVLHSLSTDSLINAIRRIVARRGPIKRIRSDLGTNMVGANNELRAELAALDSHKLQQFALRDGIEWVFNPPSASHFGGCWERCIRTFRKVWRSMPTQRLDDEGLSTLFCEIESVLNSRPLTYVSTSLSDLEPLTPNHLLLLRGCGEGIPGGFSDDSLSVKQWRRVQYLADQFWLRWKREYLPTLQRRQRWVTRSRNVESGDIVLVVDDDAPRGHWRLGRVLQTFPSRDGLVRKVSVRTSGTVLTRPVHKLIVILQPADLSLS